MDKRTWLDELIQNINEDIEKNGFDENAYLQIEQKISMKVVINDNMDLCVQLMLNDESQEVE